MFSKLRLACTTVVMLSLFSLSHAEIQLIGVTEASGGGAVAGLSFKNGYLMALEEVNAKGGVLGQKLSLTQFDIDTSPEAAKAAVAKAVALKPFAILGPVFSGLTAASSPLTAPMSLPQFTGGEAASLTTKFHPSLLRTSLSQQGSAPRISALVTNGLGFKKIALVWIENDFGKDGREALTKAIKRRGGNLVLDESIKPGQKDFGKLMSNLIQSDAEALLLYVNENEAIDVLNKLKEAKFTKPIISDGLVAAQKVIDGAGDAVEGVYAHMNASTAAPNPSVKAFTSRYESRFGVKPDQNSIKGFTAIHVIKAGIELSGKVDQSGFLKTIKDHRLDNKVYPDLLSTISYDFFGDINRESFYVVIKNKVPQIIATIQSTEGGSVELANGKIVAMNSPEFKAMLQNLPKNLSPTKPTSSK
jgi:branched-chain amino acid transport system substrate-binding protein